MIHFRNTIFQIAAVFLVLSPVTLLAGPPAGEGQGDKPVELSLRDCVGYAAANSFEVKMAKLDFYIAETENMYAESVYDTILFGGTSYEEDKRQQLYVIYPDDSQRNVYYGGVSKKLPTGTEISAQIKDTRTWARTDFAAKNPTHNFEFTFEATQPVGNNSFGYVDRKRISITRLAVDNAGLESRDAISGFMTSVEKSYWRFVYTAEVRDAYKEMLDRAVALNDATEKNYDLGLAEKVDLYATQANVSRREAEVKVRSSAYRAATEDLKMLLNMPEDKPIKAGTVLAEDEDVMSISECLKTAFEKRRDYLVDKTDVEIRGIDLNIKRNLLWPEIDLVATMAFNGLEPGLERAFDKATGTDNRYYYAGVEFSLPLENRAARSEYTKSKREKEKALLELKRTERQIITEVGNAYDLVETYLRSLSDIRKAVELQREKLREEEKRFKYGRSNTKNLIDYQRDLLQSELELIKYLYDYRVAVAELERTMDIVLDKYRDVL
jgi:outer membrane protein TolC